MIADKKTHLHGLYAITPEGMCSNLFIKVNQAILGGARLIQYRCKSGSKQMKLQEANTLLQLCHAQHTPLIINDDLDLTIAVGADGIHLGRDDIDPLLARRYLGSKAIIGISCYNDLSLAKEAEKAGANYIAFGSFFPSATKPLASSVDTETLHLAKKQIPRLPLVAIGGITVSNGAQLVAAGADMLAVSKGLFSDGDTIANAQALSHLIYISRN